MIGLDTNVLVRYLTQDDLTQARRATAVIERLTEEDRGYVSVVVIAELSWVLRTVYQVDRQELTRIVRALLAARELHIEQAEAVRRALAQTDTGADLADALIAQLSQQAGCEYTLTFDTRAAKQAGMRLVPSR